MREMTLPMPRNSAMNTTTMISRRSMPGLRRVTRCSQSGPVFLALRLGRSAFGCRLRLISVACSNTMTVRSAGQGRSGHLEGRAVLAHDVLLRRQERLDRADGKVDLVGLVVHGDDDARVERVDHRGRLLVVDGEEATHRNQQHVHSADGLRSWPRRACGPDRRGGPGARLPSSRMMMVFLPRFDPPASSCATWTPVMLTPLTVSLVG